MLSLLYNYGLENGIEETWSKEENIHVIVHIENGNFSHIETIPKDAAKKHMVPMSHYCSQGALGNNSKFLCDNVVRMFGLNRNSCKQSFIALIRESKIQSIQVVADVVENSSDVIVKEIKSKFKENLLKLTKVVFYIDGKPAIDDTTIAYWKKYVENHYSSGASLESGKKPKMGVCSITGKMSVLANALPPQLNIGMGLRLFSFNMPSHEHYGAEKTYNSPISFEAVFRIGAVINHLIQKSKDAGVFKLLNPKKNSSDTWNLICWANGTNIDAGSLFNDPKYVLGLLKSVNNKSLSADFIDANSFHASICGGSKRFVIKTYYQTTVDELKTNIESWNSQNAFFGHETSAMKDIIKSIAPIRGTGKKRKEMPDDIPAPVLRDLIACILEGKRIPRKIMDMVTTRNSSEVFSPSQKPRIEERCGLIKTYFLREKKTMQDIENSNAYRIGRLLAVVANAKYYSVYDQSNRRSASDNFIASKWKSLSTDPYRGSIMELKDALVTAYIPKLNSINPAAAVAIEREVREITVGLDFSKLKPFNWEERLAFDLGFNSQRQKMFDVAKQNAQNQTSEN